MTDTKERPVLFSAPMVRAILEGRKTVTRREVKKPAALDCLPAGFEPAFLALPGNSDLCPYGRPGDRLWVREAWQADAQVNAVAPRDLSHGEPIHYPADGATRQTGCSMFTTGRNRPSIHMPRWVSRILLEITAVRIERLQDISEEQSEAEGVITDDDRPDEHLKENRGLCHQCWGTGLYTAHGMGGALPDTDCRECDTAKKRFKNLWQSINGPEAWAANPWVWVVEFKQIKL
ncbi:hypothetical protein ACTUVN_003254 [Pseudomonas caspiana]